MSKGAGNLFSLLDACSRAMIQKEPTTSLLGNSTFIKTVSHDYAALYLHKINSFKITLKFALNIIA
jgi:hypothetical protein